MGRRNQAVQLAQTEVALKSWGVTQQLLEVNEVATDEDGKIIIARVDEKSEPGNYIVYFPIKDESYFFVVIIRPNETGDLAVSGVYMEAGVRVYLRICSSTLSPKSITERLSLTPTETHIIGEPIGSVTSKREYKEHVWHFEPQEGIPGSVEEKLGRVLDGMDSTATQVKALKPECTVEVNVVFEGWGGDPQFGGFHIDDNMLRQLSALDAELDFDLYAFGPNMTEDEDN